MADTPPTGETVTPVAPSNEPGNAPAPAPAPDNSSADVEQAKREAEQARIRANQLENELKKRDAEAEAIRQKQLEEKEEFKTLYEQTRARLKEHEDALATQVRQKELESATEEVYKEYPANVVEVAKISGLSLADDSEAATTALKEKLNTLKQTVGNSAPAPGSNNPRQTAPQAVNREELVKRDGEGVSPMAMAGAKGDNSIVNRYISDLPAIKRMKEISQQGA